MTTPYHLKYLSSDSTVLSFVKLIGLQPKIQGIITKEDAQKSKVTFGHLVAVSNFMEQDDELSSGEAQKVLDSAKKFGSSAIASLFKNDACPGAGVISEFVLEGMILRGKTGMSRWREPDYQLNVERHCPPTLPIPLLQGIFYSKELVPSAIAQAGHAVVGIRNGKLSGSGVLVSKFGDILTHRSLVDREGQTTQVVIIQKAGALDKEIQVSKASQVIADNENGIVLLRISELAGSPWVALAPEQDTDESLVWGMGANLLYSDMSDHLKGLFSPGRYLMGGISTVTLGVSYIGGGLVLGSGKLRCIISDIIIDQPNSKYDTGPSYRGSVCSSISQNIRKMIGKTPK